MKIEYKDFEKTLEQDKINNVVIFQGEENYFKFKGLNRIIDKYVTLKDLDYQEYEGEQLEISELISSLSIIPFSSQKRVVLVSEFYPKSNEILKLYNEIKNFSTSILVVINQNKTDVFDKYEEFYVVDCVKYENFGVVQFIIDKCDENNVKIDKETAKLISEYCLNDLLRVENELLKLISFVGAEKTINKNDVINLVSKDNEFKIYEITEYIARKKTEQVVLSIKDMLSKGETEQRIISYLSSYFKRLMFLQISKNDNKTDSVYLGIKEYAVIKSKQQCKLFDVKILKKISDDLSQADYSIKNGRGDEKELLWLNVFKILNY